MKKKMFIFGNSEYASLAKGYFQECGEWEFKGFAVDRQYMDSSSFCGFPLLPADECAFRYPPEEYYAFVAIGYKQMNRIREEKIKWLKEQGYHLATYVDPSCRRVSAVEIGENCFVMENVVLQPRVKIHDGVNVGSGSCIGHDVTIHDNSYIAPCSVILAHVNIGRNSFIGANSTIASGLCIADYTLTGAGTFINKNTSQYGVYLREHSKNILKNEECKEELQSRFLQ